MHYITKAMLDISITRKFITIQTTKDNLWGIHLNINEDYLNHNNYSYTYNDLKRTISYIIKNLGIQILNNFYKIK